MRLTGTQIKKEPLSLIAIEDIIKKNINRFYYIKIEHVCKLKCNIKNV